MTEIAKTNTFGSARVVFGPPEAPHYRLKLARQIGEQLQVMQSQETSEAELLAIIKYFEKTIARPAKPRKTSLHCLNP